MPEYFYAEIPPARAFAPEPEGVLDNAATFKRPVEIGVENPKKRTERLKAGCHYSAPSFRGLGMATLWTLTLTCRT